MSPPLFLIADIGFLWFGFGLRSHNIIGLFQVSITRLDRASATRGAGAGDRLVVVIIEHSAVVGLVRLVGGGGILP